MPVNGLNMYTESRGDGGVPLIVVHGLGLRQADLLGLWLGGNASLRCAIQHPGRARRLALVSIPCRRDGWHPEVLAAFDQMNGAGFEQMRRSPMYAAWSAVAPEPDSFPVLVDKTGELLRRPYDWSDEVRAITSPTPMRLAVLPGVTHYNVATSPQLGGVVDDFIA